MKAAKLCSRQEHLLIKSRRLVRLGAYLLGEIVQAFRKSLWHFQPVAYETAVALVSLVSVSQFVPRMIPSQKLDSPASALISSHGLNLQPHYPLSRDASSERAPAWLPRIEFPWRITFGAVVTFTGPFVSRRPNFKLWRPESMSTGKAASRLDFWARQAICPPNTKLSFGPFAPFLLRYRPADF